MSTGKGKYRRLPEKVGFGRVPEMGDPSEYREGKIRVSTGKGRIRVSIGEGKIRVSTGKGRIRQVLEIGDLGEYRKCGIRASTENVGSGRVPGR